MLVITSHCLITSVLLKQNTLFISYQCVLIFSFSCGVVGACFIFIFLLFFSCFHFVCFVLWFVFCLVFCFVVMVSVWYCLGLYLNVLFGDLFLLSFCFALVLIFFVLLLFRVFILFVLLCFAFVIGFHFIFDFFLNRIYTDTDRLQKKKSFH